MDEQYKQLVIYAKNALDNGTSVTELRRLMGESGWQPDLINRALTELNVNTPDQLISSPSYNVPPKKTRPPMAAQVLFAFSIIFLTLSTLMLAIVLINITSVGYRYGSSGLIPVIKVFAIALLMSFLAFKVRGRKLKPLIILTLFMFIMLMYNLYLWFNADMSLLFLFGINPYAVMAMHFLIEIIFIPPLAMLWILNRKDYIKPGSSAANSNPA